MKFAHPISFLAGCSIFNSYFASAIQPTPNITPDLLENIQIFSPYSYSTNMTRKAAVVSLSHGGGPMPLLGDPNHAAIVKSLKTRVPKILKLGTSEAPRAIVLVTAHWSTNQVTISSGSKHELLYDYYGFPPESYQIKHDAPGSPEVAEEVAKALKEAGIDCKKDPTRGKSAKLTLNGSRRCVSHEDPVVFSGGCPKSPDIHKKAKETASGDDIFPTGLVPLIDPAIWFNEERNLGYRGSQDLV